MLLRAQGSRRSLESADVVVGRLWHLRVWCACAVDTDLRGAIGERRWSAHVGYADCALQPRRVSLWFTQDKDNVGVRLESPM